MCMFPACCFHQRTYGHMFSDESNKLETYTYKNEIILKKYKSLSGPIYFEIFTFFLSLDQQKQKEFLYVFMNK